MEGIISQSLILLCTNDRNPVGLVWMHINLDEKVHAIVFRLGTQVTLEIYNKANCPPSLCVLSRDNNRLLSFAETLTSVDTVLNTPVTTANNTSEETRSYIAPNKSSLYKLINEKTPVPISFRYEHAVRDLCVIPHENVIRLPSVSVSEDEDTWSNEEVMASGGGETDLNWKSILNACIERQNDMDDQSGDKYCDAGCCKGYEDEDDVILQCGDGHAMCKACLKKTIMAYCDSMTHCTNQHLSRVDRVPVLQCPADGCIVAMAPGFLYDELYPDTDMMVLVPKIREAMEQFRKMHL